MFKLVITLTLVLLLPISVHASPENDAVKFVESIGAGKNLKVLSSRVARNTTTYRIMIAKADKEKVNRILKKELNKSIKNNQLQWNKYLAKAYLEHFTSEELNSLTNEKKKSPYRKKLIKNQRNVGLSMQKISKKLLNAVVTNALTNTYKSVL